MTFRSRRGTRGRWVLLGTAVVQAVSPPLAGFDQGSGSDPVVVPPGPFFAIWGPIVLGCLAAALWGLPLRRATAEPWRRIQLPLSLAQVGFAAWLVAAARLPVLTLPVFAGMLVALVVCLRAVVVTPADRVTRGLLGGSVGLYAGWTSAAVWINAATLLPEGAASATAPLAALLAGAALTAAALTRAVHGQPACVLAASWALLGALVSTASAGAVPLVVVAASGLAVVAATALVPLVRRPA
ncbi:hypothetical protein SAMN05660642_04247 [Geodermatophilus siccatus]|uniref:TspO and MBR related proteins n=1 Tax=Geodermatophilus siccatus TaxID=1137991 RepID=A0A1G9ZB82_9ACTN|nr:hypothetical protein [Geodermatophilus siccatus]SDN17886.1 hypothetical protein SAMN05660642_04247 [Geodermatophilus siccatus]